MTLFKQLFIGVSLGFLFLLAGIEIIYVGISRASLQDQLASHAQDVATSLGMVLPASIESGDQVITEVTVTAIFDRGYYQSIRVIDLQGVTIVEKNLSPTPPNVPEWFTSLIKLQAPLAESKITKGWRQLGRVLVTSHPNFAYKQLWNTMLGTTLWLMGLYLVCLILLRALLKKILRPLEEIEAVAESISKRNFETVLRVPKTRELKRVVLAINALSGKVRKIIEDEVATAKHYREEAYIDGLTKLDNRRSFESQLNSILGEGEHVYSGVLFMIQIEDFQEFNTAKGHETGNALLQHMGATLADIGKSRNSICARVNWATFTFASFNLTRQDALALGEEISSRFRKTIASGKYDTEINFGCGAAFFQKENVTRGNLMAIADMASLQSVHNGGGLPVIIDFKPEAEEDKGSLCWKAMITDALAENRIALLAQPVIAFKDKQKLQLEVTGRLVSADGELVEAGKFMPMAVRHGLTALVDNKLMDKTIRVLKDKGGIKDQIAINLSMRSIHDADLMEWMLATLKSQPDIARRIIFEFAEFNVAQDMPSLEKFIAKIRKLGAGFAIDNFGLHNSALDYVQALRPAYIKLSPSLIVDLLDNRENQLFISSIAKIAKSLGIKTIVLGVEDERLFDMLQRLGVDGYQGFVTGKPIRLDV